MISACDTQDFVPFGRGFIRQHPGKFQLQVQNTLQTEHGLPLLKSFRDISIQDNGKQKEHWIFCSHTKEGDNYDEELYISGHTVVWSRGGQDGARSIVKTFTMDSPVLQAFWSSFVIPETDAQGTTLDLPGETQRGICIIESSIVNCFMEDGGEYTSALPFTVSHAWVIKNGLIFERMVSPSEIRSPKNRNAPNQTVIFSMLHPLDEVAPVITRTVTAEGPKITYMTDNTQHVVFCSLEPSIVLTYDTMVGMHSVWRVRRVRGEECSAVSSSWDNTASLCQIGSGTPGVALNQSSNSYSYSRLLSSISGQSSSVSPLRSYSGRVSSPLNLMSRSQSPLVTGVAQPTIDRRSQSPSLSMGSLHRFHSPSQHAKSPGNYWRTPPVGVHNVSLINDSFCERFEPINPEVCFDHLWTEPAPPIRDGSLGKSSKAFLAKDLCGQNFLCYVISFKQQLKCVKFEESNDRSQLIFGAVAIIPAKDAVPIENHNMMIVLDTLGCLFVYSGTTKINRIHVPTLPLGSGSLSMLKLMTPISSPAHGGIFTSSRPPSAMDARFDEEFQLNQISPVPTELEESAHFEDFPISSSFIQGLRDNVGCKFTIELVNGSLCRSGLPPLTSSPGIDLCLKALKHLLPKDLALQMIGKWYTVRNTPGTLGNQSEWSLFIRCLLGMMGYDTSRLAFTSKYDSDSSMSPVQSAKKSKPSDQGSEEDWETMLNSDHHKMCRSSTEGFLGLANIEEVLDSINYSKPCSINSTAMLFTHIPSAFMALHLVYEEMKLNTLLFDELEQLVPLLFHLAGDLKSDFYLDYYQRDFSNLFHSVDDVHQVTPEDLQKMQYPNVFSRKVPSVQDWIIRSLEGRENGSVLYIPNVCINIQNIVSLYALLLNKHLNREQAIEKCLRKLPPAGHRASTVELSMSKSFCRSSPTDNSVERLVLFMVEQGMTEKDLTTLPVGVALPIREAISHCRCNPPSDWPMEAYVLIGRQDISQLLENEQSKEVATPPGSFTRKLYPRAVNKKEEDDGMENLDDELLKLRFSEDLRVQEARRLLQSAHPARIALTQRPEVGDHEFIEEQEKHLYSICIRTMALPVGRGMFTLSTHYPIPTETFPIPKLCLTGRAPPRNTTVDLTHIDIPSNMSAWPHFHNGVAAGLRIANFSEVDSTWIIYNKPKTAELTNEYPGFLMALGLNKHLVNLNILNVHDYLSKGHEMTTIGLLLGLSAAKRGTMDFATTKILSIHVPALLPPTSTELSVAYNVQVSGVMGIGLVYQGTGHRHTAEVLLSEIGRPPGPEMENCTDRESYSLAAGLALGLVMFGKGAETVGTSDLSMADTLCHFMIGGHKRPLTGQAKERYRTPSFQIKEGDNVNIDVTSPGATLALGMLYFNTGNSSVSEWLQVPESQFMLDQVRPDFLMLRILSRGLVMWDKVLPTFDYIKSNIPEILTKYAFQKKEEGEDDDNSIDYETMSQAYCNVIAGASMVIGLKFAGTANQMAFNTLMECMKRTLRVISTPSLVEQAGKSTVESCMINILLAMAMVMAGTGNLDVLRICRMFRSRVGPPYNLYVMYGSHMAISMAIGLLFLGGGRYTLSTNPEAIGMLLCAFYPKFPIHSNDNRYHLQAFRHLYVLAAEPRVMLPRDVDTGYACYVPLEIKFKDTTNYKNVSYKTSAPCILPELDLIEEIKILGPRYWPIVFHVDKNWNTLQQLLLHNGTLYVKQRAGHLSYMEDPKGYRSMLAMSLTAEHFTPRTVKPDVIKSFTSDNKILALVEHFLGKDENKKESLLQLLSAVVYECVTLERPEVISTHITLEQILRRSELQQASIGITQLKLIFAYYSHALQQLYDKQVAVQVTQTNPRPKQENRYLKQLLKPEFLISVKNRLERVFDHWEIENQNLLVKYLRGEILRGHDTSSLPAYLMWFDIPPPSDLAQITVNGLPTLPVLYSKLPYLKAGSVIKLHAIWQASTRME